ncbi:unnamed protein product, partial [Cercospora beticola]
MYLATLLAMGLLASRDVIAAPAPVTGEIGAPLEARQYIGTPYAYYKYKDATGNEKRDLEAGPIEALEKRQYIGVPYAYYNNYKDAA